MKNFQRLSDEGSLSLNEWQNLLADLKRIAERYGLEHIEEAVNHLKLGRQCR